MEAETERTMGAAMTDEERQELVAKLRSTWSTVAEQNKAADELERLVCIVCEARKLLGENFEVYDKIKGHAVTQAQSDAEPVELDPIMWEACECLAEWADMPNVTKYAFSIYKRTLEVLPKFKAVLDATSSRPDTSAGLIEAAEWHEAAMKETMIPQKIMVHKAAAAHFRARTPDRSGPADYIPPGGAGNGA
jgi:hypothetical protein